MIGSGGLVTVVSDLCNPAGRDITGIPLNCWDFLQYSEAAISFQWDLLDLEIKPGLLHRSQKSLLTEPSGKPSGYHEAYINI